MSRAQCPVRSGPAPVRGGGPATASYHDCAGTPGHMGNHQCGCEYEWRMLGETPVRVGMPFVTERRCDPK
jgi:hypothetical protein